jgi:hypothetical protein
MSALSQEYATSVPVSSRNAAAMHTVLKKTLSLCSLDAALKIPKFCSPNNPENPCCLLACLLASFL